MTRRRQHALQARSAELALAVPQVVMHRLARMATAGANPSARDQREFQLMGLEKAAAFAESWMAMFMQAQVASQTMAAATLKGWWQPWLGGSADGYNTLARQWQGAMLGILSHGLAPVHRTAMANARRLGRARRR